MTDELDIDPWAFQRWAYKTRVGSPARKAVLMVLAVMVDTNTGRCEAKQDTLATACETTDRTIRDHLTVLEHNGVIARRHQQRGDGSRRNDEYLLLAPWVNEWPDGTPVQRPLSPIQPEDSSGADLPDISSARSEPTGNLKQGQPEVSDRSNRKQASGQERPKEQPEKNDQAERVSEARVRALDPVPLELSDSERSAVDGLAYLLSMRSRELTERDRAGLVAAMRAAAPVDPAPAVRALEAWYGEQGRGAKQPINSITALLTTELARRTSAPEPRPSRFVFRKPSNPGAARQPAETSDRVTLPADLQPPTDRLLRDWQAVRDQLRAASRETTWAIWLEPLKLAGYTTSLVTELDDDTERPLRTLYITAPADTIAWVETRMTRLIRATVTSVLGDDIPVRIVEHQEQTQPQATPRPAREEAA